MIKIKHILVPSDFSDTARQALAHAISLAHRYNAKITLLHVVTIFDDDPYNPKQTFPDLDDYYDHIQRRAGEKIKSTISKKIIENLQIEYMVLRGFSPYEEILSFAADNNVDLITMGTHGRNRLASFFLGSVAEKVVRHATCPVLTTKISSEKIKSLPTYNRLLVPTDFSDQSRRALQFAASLLDGQQGNIDILHVIEDVIHPAYYNSEKGSIFELVPDLKEKTKKSLQEITDELLPKDKMGRVVVQEGKIAQTITDYCDNEKIDMIVMGTHGMNFISQFLIGSVANRVLRNVACPVITIK